MGIVVLVCLRVASMCVIARTVRADWAAWEELEDSVDPDLEHVDQRPLQSAVRHPRVGHSRGDLPSAA